MTLLQGSSSLSSSIEDTPWQRLSSTERWLITKNAGLYWTALYWTALPCTAVLCSALHCTELLCTAMTALHCAALQCTALNCTAINCFSLLHTAVNSQKHNCTLLHCTGMHFSSPLHTEVNHHFSPGVSLCWTWNKTLLIGSSCSAGNAQKCILVVVQCAFFCWKWFFF